MIGNDIVDLQCARKESNWQRKGFLETSALIQIKDKKDKSKDSVFLFNNWMFVSNSTINEIEHPSYDIWLKRCI